MRSQRRGGLVGWAGWMLIEAFIIWEALTSIV